MYQSMKPVDRRIARCRQEIGTPNYDDEPCLSCHDKFACVTSRQLNFVSIDVNYTFEVPNDKEGQEFRRLCSKFLVHQRWGIRWRGRGAGRGRRDVRVDAADYWVAYLKKKEVNNG